MRQTSYTPASQIFDCRTTGLWSPFHFSHPFHDHTALCYHIHLQFLCNLQFTHLSEPKLVTLQLSHSWPTLLLFLVLKTGQSFEPPLGSYHLPPIFTSFPICLVFSFWGFSVCPRITNCLGLLRTEEFSQSSLAQARTSVTLVCYIHMWTYCMMGLHVSLPAPCSVTSH